jgi:hypothetical protein
MSNTYFVDVHERYADTLTSNYKNGIVHMARAFGVSEHELRRCARTSQVLKITDAQLGNYIAYRFLGGVPSAVSELKIRRTPDNYLDLTSHGASAGGDS